MKLYYYDHCPFGARVRMVLNLKGIDAERVVLPADDEQTITSLIGKHQIPVLVRDDDDTSMADSMDIINYFDHLNSQPIIQAPDTAVLKAWIEPFVPNLQYLAIHAGRRSAWKNSPALRPLHISAKRRPTPSATSTRRWSTLRPRGVRLKLSCSSWPERIDLTPTDQRPCWDDVTLFSMRSPALRHFQRSACLAWYYHA